MQFGQNEGLNNLSVQAAAIDERGFIWVGTDDGLFRFDGHRFLRIDLQLQDLAQRTTDLQAVRDIQASKLLAVPGAMYIASAGRVWRYDLKTHTLSLIRNVRGETFRAETLARREDGTIFAVGDSLLWAWRDAIDARAAPIELLADGSVSGVSAIQFGVSGAWLFAESGTYQLELASESGSKMIPDTAHAVSLRIDEPALKFGATRATSGYEFPKGTLWIGYWNDGLLKLDLLTGKHRWFHPGKPGAGALRSTSIYKFAAREDRLYIATNRGMVVYHPSCDCLRGLNHPSWDQLDGAGIIVNSLVLENSGPASGIWAGVWGGGLVRFSQTDEAIERQVKRDSQIASAPSNGLAHPMVSALHVADKRLWIGTYGGGVQYVDSEKQFIGESWALNRLRLQPELSAPITGLPIEASFTWHISGSMSQLTIGTGFGLFRAQPPEVMELRLQANEKGAQAATLQSIRTSFVAQDGTHYIGTTRGFYRERMSAGQSVIEAIPLQALSADKPLPSGIWSIIEHQQVLWLGTGNGLIRLTRSAENSRWEVLALHQKGMASDQLPGAAVWVQKQDASGTLWLGTSGGLVSVAGTPDQPQFNRHPALDRIGVKTINSIEFDRAGKLWLGGPTGLASYVPERKIAQHYDRFDGLIGSQLNFNASAKSGADEPYERIYFGGIGGLISFNPAHMPERQENLQPQISRLRVGQQSWQIGARALNLPHMHEALQVELTSLNFSKPSQVQYAYRWKNLEAEFTELGDAKSVVLARLPSGVNQLEVRARLGSTEAISEVLTLKIAYIWHETWWGRLLLAFAATVVIYAAMRWRIRQARQFTRVLQAQVTERTALLREASDALSQANAQLKIQATLDPLTGLANRRHLFEVAHIHAAKGDSLSVLVADLDHFKRINDTYGHHVGDAVLMDFAELLMNEIVQSEIGPTEFGYVASKGLAARYGGEEFVVLLFNVSKHQLEAFGERIITQARQRCVAQTKLLAASALAADQDVIRYTASVGLVLGDVERSLEALIRTADLALYKAKHQGRDRWVMGN
jgi:diguanylate cyclase (GGDEF)-like protein